MGYIVSLVWMAESPPRRMGEMLQSILRPTLRRKVEEELGEFS